MFIAQCFQEWDCEDGKVSPLPCCICASGSKDRCTERYKQGYTYWIPKGVMKSVRSTTYAGVCCLPLVHQMKNTSKLPSLGIHFILILIPPGTRLESSPMPLSPLPLSLHSGVKETQRQVSLEPQCTPTAIQCRQLGCRMFISRWTWMKSVCIGDLF